MRVIDVFCGAGGFSEGFKQAGFDIIFGVDKWMPAVTTHHANHPEAITILDDVIRISLLPEEEFELIVPDSEVIIGSPPCVAFSNSNRSGKGDKSEGIKLIKAYLRIVARKKWKKKSKLKYWVLENVPNVEKFIKDFYSAEELNLQGKKNLVVKNGSSGIYNAVNFGVPSRRKRYFCGDFPKPQKTITNNEDVILLRDVLNNLGFPKEKESEVIIDPNYDFKLLGLKVSDHHYVQPIAKYQWTKAKRLKQDKGYMGRMSFPENLDRPSRTVMATLTFSARESMVFPYNNGIEKYRAPTIREVASLMSFPIDYNFYGNSIGLKYKLVGNAVPPKLAYSIAKEIAKKEKLNIPKNHIPISFNNNNNFYNLNGEVFSVPVEKPKRSSARFKYHIPYLIIDSFRVELTNYHSDFSQNGIAWDIEIHKSQGPRAKIYTPKMSPNCIPLDKRTVVERFIDEYSISKKDYNNFQKIYCSTYFQRKKNNLIGPEELLGEIMKFMQSHLFHIKDKEVYYINQAPNSLPTKIAAGYFILQNIFNK
jgi:DNA (cytosine-5)-methyltransferase 1